VRATNVKFTVTAAGIIFDREGRVLLIKHRFRPGSGWGIPGGFLQAGEEPVDALRRELREEIGLELDQPRIFDVRTFSRHSQLEVVFLVNASGETQPKSIEVECVAWFKPDSLPDQLPSDQKKLIRSALHDGAKGPD
jgi:ADP-ribose pyrophosphatase YjhB (NUDIX family)